MCEKEGADHSDNDTGDFECGDRETVSEDQRYRLMIFQKRRTMEIMLERRRTWEDRVNLIAMS